MPVGSMSVDGQFKPPGSIAFRLTWLPARLWGWDLPGVGKRRAGNS